MLSRAGMFPCHWVQFWSSHVYNLTLSQHKLRLEWTILMVSCLLFLGEKEHWSRVMNSTTDLSVLIKNSLLAPDTQASFPCRVSRTALWHRSFQNPEGNSSAGSFQSHMSTFPRSGSVLGDHLARSNDSRLALPPARAGISGLSFFSNSSPLFLASPSSLAWAKSQSQISVT